MTFQLDSVHKSALFVKNFPIPFLISRGNIHVLYISESTQVWGWFKLSSVLCEKRAELSESDFLLVTHLMTFIHHNLWYGKLVPSSHQRGKPSHTMLCSFNRGNNLEMHPISDCLREELALVNVSSCSGGLKSQTAMISIVPNCGYKIISWNAGSTL